MTKKSFVIMVTKAPFDSPNPYQALQFCKAALAMGHNIAQVFFYQSGALNASKLQVYAGDEYRIYDAWCELSQEFQIPLNVCISAASRRGIVDNQSAELPNMFNVVAPFNIVGISDYFASLDNHISIQL